jgi:hypothetical protein
MICAGQRVRLRRPGVDKYDLLIIDPLLLEHAGESPGSPISNVPRNDDYANKRRSGSQSSESFLLRNANFNPEEF